MLKRAVILFVSSAFLLSLAGCATARKQKDMELQGLRNEVSVLEAQLTAKDEEIASLRDALTRTTDEKAGLESALGKKKTVFEAKSRPSPKQIQTALLNAGYDPGSIDGKMGKKTRQAIKAFQKDNNLKPDGKVGRETWGLLKKHLENKNK